jgi:CO/xanthine dehydrogenase Mo-binding subunit
LAHRRNKRWLIWDISPDAVKETGYVKILRYTAVQDVGRAIHPSYVEGQIQGSVTQGIGWALNEEYIYDKDGSPRKSGLPRLPRADGTRRADDRYGHGGEREPAHPFGARGSVEVPIVPPMAAVANAIADATGIRMRDLPMSPPRLRTAIDQNGG